MSENYDSILKEEKQTTTSKLSQISEENSTKPNYVIIFLFLTTIILIVSYIVYYNTILNGKNIFLNNLNTISNEYKNIYSNLFNFNIFNDYTLNGNIDIINGEDVRNLEYTLNKKEDTLYLNIKEYLEYYINNTNNYIKSSNINNNYIEDNNNFINYLFGYNNLINNISNYLDNKNNYNKSIYFENEQPILKIEFNLNKDSINNIINNSKFVINDDININVILLNNAITNKIINTKIVINNNTKNIRDVYIYENNIITHSNDNGINEKIEIFNDNENFDLNYYKNDILYSVMKGSKTDNTYNYLYQIIDNKYTLKLTITNTNNTYNYLLESNIDTDTKKYIFNMTVDGEYSSDSNIIVNLDNVISKKELTEEEINNYNNILKYIFGIDFKDMLLNN